MKNLDDIKNQVENKLRVLKPKVRVNDPVFNFLSKDPVAEFIFDSGLRMLPYELVEKYGMKMLEDKGEYDKYKDPSKYDVFRMEWDNHLLGYWNDKLQLLDEYLNPSKTDETPLQMFNRLSDLMIKIERRSLLLSGNPVEVIQPNPRHRNDDYKFLRSYWVDDDGKKKRMIARHVTKRYERLEMEIADLFHNRGYAVHRSYKSSNGRMYDMVIEMAGVKTAVEIKLINKEIFGLLFMFDELCKRFDEDYKNTP